MSYPQCEAPAALLAQFDAKAWSGVEIFARDTSTVSLPTYSGLGGGIYADALDFLNGRGVAAAEAWPAYLSTAWAAGGAAGTVTLEIDPTTGHLAIEASATDFEITEDASLAILGFDAAGHDVVGGAAPYRRVAPNPFKLGEVELLEFEITAGPAVINMFDSRYVQDVITAMRAHGGGDADDRAATSSVQYQDATANGLTVRWGIDQYGHCTIGRATSSTDALAWSSTSFRDRLGFSGNEVETTSGPISILRADYPMPGVIVFADGLDSDMPDDDDVGAGAELIGHGAAGLTIGSRRFSKITAHITGPAAARDTHEHYRARFLPYAPPSKPVALYRMWGDPRRRLRAFDVTSTQAAHDLVYTTGAGGYRGRFDGHRAANDSRSVQIAWDGDIMQQAQITMRVREA